MHDVEAVMMQWKKDLPSGSGTRAFSLVLMRGMKELLPLSTWSRNLSCGRVTFREWMNLYTPICFFTES